MSEIPLGLSLTEGDNEHLLRRKEIDGSVTSISMSLGELLGLKAEISQWENRILSHTQVESGSVRPVIAHHVERVRFDLDAIQENVLMTVAAPSGEQKTLSFSPAVADCILEELPPVLEALRAAIPAKQ